MTPRERLERRIVPRLVVALSTVRGPGRVAAKLRRALGGRGRVTLFVAFDDPYSAVALVTLAERLRARPVDIDVEAVVARGIADDPAREAKRSYALVDAGRLARRSGRELARETLLDPAAVAFLARRAGALPQGRTRLDFCVAAAQRLWFGPGADLDPATWPDPGESTVAAAERRMRRRRLYDTPVAVVGGQWFFAHERLDAIEHRLDELGWAPA